MLYCLGESSLVLVGRESRAVPCGGHKGWEGTLDRSRCRLKVEGEKTEDTDRKWELLPQDNCTCGYEAVIQKDGDCLT